MMQRFLILPVLAAAVLWMAAPAADVMASPDRHPCPDTSISDRHPCPGDDSKVDRHPCPGDDSKADRHPCPET